MFWYPDIPSARLGFSLRLPISLQALVDVFGGRSADWPVSDRFQASKPAWFLAFQWQEQVKLIRREFFQKGTLST
jgi:hypothetical protein